MCSYRILIQFIYYIIVTILHKSYLIHKTEMLPSPVHNQSTCDNVLWLHLPMTPPCSHCYPLGSVTYRTCKVNHRMWCLQQDFLSPLVKLCALVMESSFPLGYLCMLWSTLPSEVLVPLRLLGTHNRMLDSSITIPKKKVGKKLTPMV